MVSNTAFTSLYKYTKGLSVALGYRDHMTRLHSDRVLALALEMGLHCGLPAREFNALRIGAAFHDIGKIGVPDHVLLKPGKLDEADWKRMAAHSEIGQQILLGTDLKGAKSAALAIRHHHERFNGTGYPDGLRGDRIPLTARIIGIADSYDAMAVTRTYHAARSHREIMDIMRCETGDKHDPELMQLFVKIIDHSPLKSAPAD
jgi:HD-GYP domain-containing protein (c-di-GMP phosphodiesterase class II)